jgi:hypothetical protein
MAKERGIGGGNRESERRMKRVGRERERKQRE